MQAADSSTSVGVGSRIVQGEGGHLKAGTWSFPEGLDTQEHSIATAEAALAVERILRAEIPSRDFASAAADTHCCRHGRVKTLQALHAIFSIAVVFVVADQVGTASS